MATFGERLRRAREAAQMSGPQMARELRVSAQTVSEWERGRYFPAADKLARIAQLTSVKVDWLLTGQNDHAPGGASLLQGRLVSKIPFDDLPNFDPRGKISATYDKVHTHFPCGPHSFQITVSDRSNAPDYEPGDSVIIDPDLKPNPGDMVLVVSDNSVLFRRYRPRAGTVELIPLNGDWETVTIRLDKTTHLLGTMSERAQQRR
jgi:transcriptional regulator with XRE-family HTH domain